MWDISANKRAKKEDEKEREVTWIENEKKSIIFFRDDYDCVQRESKIIYRQMPAVYKWV